MISTQDPNMAHQQQQIQAQQSLQQNQQQTLQVTQQQSGSNVGTGLLSTATLDATSGTPKVSFDLAHKC